MVGYLERVKKTFLVIKVQKKINLLGQLEKEDPEGNYRPEFVSEILSRLHDKDIDSAVSSLKNFVRE
jgi:hypothetical protein